MVHNPDRDDVCVHGANVIIHKFSKRQSNVQGVDTEQLFRNGVLRDIRSSVNKLDVRVSGECSLRHFDLWSTVARVLSNRDTRVSVGKDFARSE